MWQAASRPPNPRRGEVRKALIPAFLLVVLSVVLGATVFREPVAWAAQTVDANIIGPLDGNGNVKVHEQGTANVNVLGTASTKAAIPPNAFSITVPFLGSGGPPGPPDEVVLGPDPAGTSYVITSVTFASSVDYVVHAELDAFWG
jgi:hypothetical protein